MTIVSFVERWDLTLMCPSFLISRWRELSSDFEDEAGFRNNSPDWSIQTGILFALDGLGSTLKEVPKLLIFYVCVVFLPCRQSSIIIMVWCRYLLNCAWPHLHIIQNLIPLITKYTPMMTISIALEGTYAYIPYLKRPTTTIESPNAIVRMAKVIEAFEEWAYQSGNPEHVAGLQCIQFLWHTFSDLRAGGRHRHSAQGCRLRDARRWIV